MPTITVGDLQKLIEAVSYERFERDAIKQVSRPQSAKPPRLRPPPRSSNRPSTAPRFRSSSPKENEEVPKRKRPQSAKSHVSINESDLDYTGVTNMMQGIKITQNKKWKAKSSTNLNQPQESHRSAKSEADQQKIFKNLENSSFIKNRTFDNNKLRKSRPSSFGRFRYPLQLHMSKHSQAVKVLEQSIPASLRRFPWYTNQPVRQNCNYAPPVHPVTKVRSHVLRSNSLPNIAAAKPPIAPKTSQSVIHDAPQVNTEGVGTLEADERERNGNFHYVYQGPPTKFNTLIDGQDAEGSISQIIHDNTPRITDEEFDEINGLVDQLDEIDKYSEATDDYFNSDAVCDVGSPRKTVRSNHADDEEEKRSFEDMNDVNNVADISSEALSTHSDTMAGIREETKAYSPLPQSNLRYSPEMDDVIDEDIPEEIPQAIREFQRPQRMYASTNISSFSGNKLY